MVNTFRSERLIFRPYTMDDVPTLHKLRNEESRRRWFYFQEPDILTEQAAVKSVEDNIELWSHKLDILKEEAGFAIALKDSNELIGFVGLGKVRCEHVEIGYEIGEQYQGRGFATEAVKAVIDWGFDLLKQAGAEVRIICKVEHDNLASRKVAEKAGMNFIHAEQYVSVYEICG